MGDGYPSVDEDRLESGGWERSARTEETVFRIPSATVVGRTVLYADADLREALDDAGVGDRLAPDGDDRDDDRLVETDEEGYWRFFFATSLSFRPPLPGGIGTAAVFGIVSHEARRAFATDFEARGFEDVERGQSQRMRTDAGDRARLTKVTARYPFDDPPPQALAVEGWLAVWTRDGGFRVAGGAYPVEGLDELLASLPPGERPSTDPRAFREELLDLVRGVQ